MNNTQLQQNFQSIQDELAGFVNYDEIEFARLYELVNKCLVISNDYARVKRKVIDVHQRNIDINNLIVSIRDQKQLIGYRREVFKMIKITLNNNIAVFIKELTDSKATN